MSEQQHNANVPKIHKRHIDLFPKRRQSDHRAPLNGGYLTTFTDLMALLLTFFILIYATRDPAPIRLIVIDPPAIAAPVKPTPPNIADVPSLNKGENSLELNYIAGLLSQAATREPALENAQITPFPFALHVELPTLSVEAADLVLSRTSGINRSILISAPQAIIDELWARYNDDITYIVSDNNRAQILIH